MPRDACEMCRFWEAGKVGSGLCRRYPGVPLYEPYFDNAGMRFMIVTYWPNAFATDWCGEHSPKDEPDAT